jgi:hypothetical protein
MKISRVINSSKPNTVHLTNIFMVFCFWGEGLQKEAFHACYRRGFFHACDGCL